MSLVACSSKASPPEPEPEPEAERREPSPPRSAPASTSSAPGSASSAPDPAAAAPPGRRTIRWTNVERTDDCFFFSGPEGRDDQLVGDVVVETVEREGDHLRLRIGTAVFEGTYVDHELSLTRTSRYEFKGPWQITETIRGRVDQGVLAARYRYEECELQERCPGHCAISGELTFSSAL